jgi:hypothetical protein
MAGVARYISKKFHKRVERNIPEQNKALYIATPTQGEGVCGRHRSLISIYPSIIDPFMEPCKMARCS